MKKLPDIYRNTPIDNAELEKGETVVLPDLSFFKIDGKKHKAGGESVVLPSGSMIFSQHIKLPASQVKSIIDVDKEMSPADISKKFDSKKMLDVLEHQEYDELSKKTAGLMLAKNVQGLSTTFQAQEDFKKQDAELKKSMKVNNVFMKYGGKKKMQAGGLTGVPNPFQNVNNATLPAISGNNNVGLPNGVTMFEYGTNTIPIGTGFDAVEPVSMSGLKIQDSIPTKKQLFTDLDFVKQNLAAKKLYNDPRVKEYQQKSLGVAEIKPDGTYVYNSDPTSLQTRRQIAEHTLNEHGNPRWSHIDVYGLKADGTKVKLQKGQPVNSSEYVDFELPGYIDSDNVWEQPMFYEESRNTYIVDDPLQPLSKKPISPINVGKPILPSLQVNNTGQVPQSNQVNNTDRNTEDLIYNLEQGINLSTLASLRAKNPYYTYTPSEIAYTRVQPVNTLANERAFNLAAQNIETSGLPEQIKTARLADLQAKMQDGVNQISVNNYQQDIANDNANIERFNQTRNRDLQERVRANYQYAQEQDRAQGMLQDTRTKLTENIFGLLRNKVEDNNKRKLINTFFNNFTYTGNGNVQYKPNQTVDWNVLSGYSGGSNNVIQDLQTKYQAGTLTRQDIEYAKLMLGK